MFVFSANAHIDFSKKHECWSRWAVLLSKDQRSFCWTFKPPSTPSIDLHYGNRLLSNGISEKCACVCRSSKSYIAIHHIGLMSTTTFHYPSPSAVEYDKTAVYSHFLSTLPQSIIHWGLSGLLDGEVVVPPEKRPFDI